MLDLSKLLSHPLVLRSAWARVRSWYHSAEFRPEPEYSFWQTNVDEELFALGRDLAAGTYEVGPFTLVPYPKQNAILRHYALPSIRDQVAFAVFGILLAPVIETQIPNFVFGNRWYRGIFKNKIEDGVSVWEKRPFYISDTKIYEPYRRSHGLFRRVCHWTAASMLGTEPSSWGNFAQPLLPDDYPRESLPPFVQKDWWSSRSRSTERGYWFQADLQLAYPSMRLEYLKRQLLKICRASLIDPSESVGALESFSISSEPVRCFDGYPEEVAAALLTNDSLREQLATSLIELLGTISYVSYSPNNAWIPEHIGDQKLPSEVPNASIGLPTGLAISGLLMNVYLSHFDYHLADWLERKKKESCGAAFLRFADDFILMSPDVDVLNEGIDEIWSGLADGAKESVISVPSDAETTNLRINWSKVKPESISKSINAYRKESGWIPCPDCGELLHPNSPIKRLSFSDWWKSSSEETKGSIEFDALTKSKLGPFVTYLVERLSTVAGDNLFNRFGQLASDRIVQLHELIRYTLDDGQVKNDTRLSFSANRLSSAWLPDESQEPARTALFDIRTSVQESVRRAPWKFQLWRAVVRCAVRRPPSCAPQQVMEWNKDQNSAKAWLCEMLSQISTKSESNESWIRFWPERNAHNHCRGSNIEWRTLYLSFLRTAFWTALADTIKELSKLSENLGDESKVDTTLSDDRWSSRSWTFRAMSESQVKPILEWLSYLEDWANCLYSGNESLEQWEANALIRALLSTINRKDILRLVADTNSLSLAPGLLKVDTGSIKLRLPDTSLFENLPLIKRVLHSSDGLFSSTAIDEPKSAWPLVILAASDPGGNKLLAKILGSWKGVNRSKGLRVASSLGVSNYFSKKYFDNAEFDRKITDPIGSKNLLKGYKNLVEYSHLRKLTTFNSRMNHRFGKMTIYRLLWGKAWEISPIEMWHPEPWSLPAIGLPTSVALQMLKDALRSALKNFGAIKDDSAPYPYTWVLNPDIAILLEYGRRAQFGFESVKPPINVDSATFWISESVTKNDWEVHPHPAYFLPLRLGLVRRDSLKFRLWCHLLTFFLAIDGTEKILDSFMEVGQGVVPFEERWSLRNKIHLSATTWKLLDRVRTWFSFDSSWDDDKTSTFLSRFVSEDSTQKMIHDLLKEISNLDTNGASFEDFIWERIDVYLQTNADLELPRSVRAWRDLEKCPDLKEQFSFSYEPPDEETLRVRIAQIQSTQDWSRYIHRFPVLTRTEIQNIMRQVTFAFQSEDTVNRPLTAPVDAVGIPIQDPSSNNIALIIFPELTLPRSEVTSVIDMVSRTGRAALIGSQLHMLPTVSQSKKTAKGQTRFVVNEAMLAVPIYASAFSTGCLVRQFWIRKPIPAPIELGFIEALNHNYTAKQISFRILPGRRWYRFWHQHWGDFTIAICADLIDPSPWHSMQGQILHLFMCAFNKDVDLFESMTWVRAYENYINVASTNHGLYGGSFVWTPKHSHYREVTKLRGADIFLTADVALPVRELWFEQTHGVATSIQNYKDFWITGRRPQRRFKAPPPGYQGRT